MDRMTLQEPGMTGDRDSLQEKEEGMFHPIL
jgi:hypothetical protein